MEDLRMTPKETVSWGSSTNGNMHLVSFYEDDLLPPKIF
jgi:hypothetical protein